jgi:hypothetical protein
MIFVEAGSSTDSSRVVLYTGAWAPQVSFEFILCGMDAPPIQSELEEIYDR